MDYPLLESQGLVFLKTSKIGNPKSKIGWSKLFNQVKEIADRDYSILTTRVNSRDISRLDPWGKQLWRGNQFPGNLLDYLEYQPGASFVANTSGYKVHSGLNAARNIGLKAIGRHKN